MIKILQESIDDNSSSQVVINDLIKYGKQINDLFQQILKPYKQEYDLKNDYAVQRMIYDDIIGMYVAILPIDVRSYWDDIFTDPKFFEHLTDTIIADYKQNFKRITPLNLWLRKLEDIRKPFKQTIKWLNYYLSTISDDQI